MRKNCWRSRSRRIRTSNAMLRPAKDSAIMKNKINAPSISLAVAFLLACAFSSTPAQTTAPQPQTQDITRTQTTQAPNLQQELGLSPEQIQKWRALNQDLGPQELAGNQKLRQARRALADAMESPSPNEEVIKQRAKELADVQSTMTQLQALRQAQIGSTRLNSSHSQISYAVF